MRRHHARHASKIPILHLVHSSPSLSPTSAFEQSNCESTFQNNHLQAIALLELHVFFSPNRPLSLSASPQRAPRRVQPLLPPLSVPFFLRIPVVFRFFASRFASPASPQASRSLSRSVLLRFAPSTPRIQSVSLRACRGFVPRPIREGAARPLEAAGGFDDPAASVEPHFHAFRRIRIELPRRISSNSPIKPP